MTKFTDKLDKQLIDFVGRRYDSFADLHEAKEEARQQILEAIGEAIGPDEKPDTERAAGIENGRRLYEPAYSLRAQFINGERNRIRQALGITKGEADE